MDTTQDMLWVVVEESEAGATTVGVYASLEKARDVVASHGRDRLMDFRIEGHVLDAGKEQPIPWHVGLTREGDVIGATVFVGCNCQDDEVEYLKRSFIEDGGERMYVMVFATTPGQAIVAAKRYRGWLLEEGVWTHERMPLQPIVGGAAGEAAQPAT